MSFNEWDCIETLQKISSAQAKFKEDRVLDTDGDGVSEYGYLQELSGATMRVRGERLPTETRRWEYFDEDLGKVDEDGILRKDGYYFRMFLPSAHAKPAGETAPLPVADAANADRQEQAWVCYAWPAFFNTTGKRCFAVNQQGEVFYSRNDNNGRPYYCGLGSMPDATASFLKGNTDADILMAPFPNTPKGEVANDGQMWIPATQ